MDRNTTPPARPFTFHHLHTVSYDENYAITGHANGAATQPRQVIVNLEAPDIHHALEIAGKRYITVFRPFAACFSGVGITVLERRALNDDEGVLLIEEETDRTRHIHHVPVSGSHPEEWLESANAVRHALTTNPCLKAIYDTALDAEPTHPHLRISKTSDLLLSSASYDGFIPLTLPHAARWLHELGLDLPDCAQAALEEGLEIDLSDDPGPLDDDVSREPPRFTTPYTYAALATLPAGEPRDLLMHLLRRMDKRAALDLAMRIARQQPRRLHPGVIGVLDRHKRLLDSFDDAKTLAFALADLGW